MKTLALINELNYYDCAIFKAFSEVDIAVWISEQEARIKNGSVFSKAKVSLIQFRHIEPANRAALYRAFSIAALPAKYSEPLIMQGCRKENCIKAGVSPLPLIGYTDSINHHNTRNATTASSNGYNCKLANPSLFDEWWGGGFIQPIAYKQDSLVKVSLTTVCGN